MSILVIAEHDNQSLKGATLNAMTAASKIGGDVHIAVIGANLGAVAQAAASVATDLEQAARAADIISCATLSTAPLIRGEWLQPGTHLDLIGGFTPAMRESDDACFARGTVFVDTSEALMKSGDILEPIASGAWEQARLAATLEDLCRGKHAGRSL